MFKKIYTIKMKNTNKKKKTAHLEINENKINILKNEILTTDQINTLQRHPMLSAAI